MVAPTDTENPNSPNDADYPLEFPAPSNLDASMTAMLVDVRRWAWEQLKGWGKREIRGGGIQTFSLEDRIDEANKLVDWVFCGSPMSYDEERSTALHFHLFSILKRDERDYDPYGKVEHNGSDCSCGCAHYLVLEDAPGTAISMDWGVCMNPASHRCGLLTFEHQGCPKFEPQPKPEQ